MCPHIFFRLSLSSFIINTLKTNYLTSSSLTILTLCVIIFLKTVIIFSPITTALISHFCAANAIVDWHFSQKRSTPQRAISCHFQSGNHPLLHVFGEHGCLHHAAIYHHSEYRMSHYYITPKISKACFVKLMGNPAILDLKIPSKEKYTDGIPANNKTRINRYVFANIP